MMWILSVIVLATSLTYVSRNLTNETNSLIFATLGLIFTLAKILGNAAWVFPALLAIIVSYAFDIKAHIDDSFVELEITVRELTKQGEKGRLDGEGDDV